MIDLAGFFCGLFCVILVIDSILTFLDFLIIQGGIIRMIIPHGLMCLLRLYCAEAYHFRLCQGVPRKCTFLEHQMESSHPSNIGVKHTWGWCKTPSVSEPSQAPSPCFCLSPSCIPSRVWPHALSQNVQTAHDISIVKLTGLSCLRSWVKYAATTRTSPRPPSLQSHPRSGKSTLCNGCRTGLHQHAVTVVL